MRAVAGYLFPCARHVPITEPFPTCRAQGSYEPWTDRMTIRFFGLDGEMSSADLDKGGRLIQIGVTAHSNFDFTDATGDEAFSALINPGPNAWASIAEAVHGFTEADVAAATPAAEVDAQLVEWMVAHGADRKRRGNNVPVGFNVGAFDMPHLAAVLPLSSAMFARRSGDLNSLMFALDGSAYDGVERDAEEWKVLASTFAARTISALRTNTSAAAHDAGYDALLHLHSWRFLRAVCQGRPRAMPTEEAPVAASQTMALALIAAYGRQTASLISGLPVEYIDQWSRGGRAVNTRYLAALGSAFAALP